MSRVFAYCRVSTTEQTTVNQVIQITNSGFAVEPHRIVEEVISGSVQASKRPKFNALFDKLEKGDRLIVTKIDRLGRDNIDVQQTIDKLLAAGCWYFRSLIRHWRNRSGKRRREDDPQHVERLCAV
nr:recombinase family protein [Enterobacter asburiae]